MLRVLIDKVMVRPIGSGGGAELELFGDLITVINLGSEVNSERKKAALVGAALSATEACSVSVVAGARNHRDRHSLVVAI